MTETAMTAKTVKTAMVVSLCCIYNCVGQAKGGKVLSRTAKTVKTATTIMKDTPLKLNPPFPTS